MCVCVCVYMYVSACWFVGVSVRVCVYKKIGCYSYFRCVDQARILNIFLRYGCFSSYTSEYHFEILAVVCPNVTNKFQMVIGWLFHAVLVSVRRYSGNMDFSNLKHSTMPYSYLQHAN